MMFGFKIIPVAIHSHMPTFEGKFSNDGFAEIYVDYKRVPTVEHRVSKTILGYTHERYSYRPPGIPDPLLRNALGGS